MIDWDLAERIASMAGGDPPPARLRADLPELARTSQAAVAEYTGLVPAAALPPPEAVDRPEWVRANLATMRRLFDPIADRLAPDLPGPLGGAVRAGSGWLIAAEVGAITGYLSQRVLGQYDIVLLDATAPPRLLFVAPNLRKAAGDLRADEDELVAWVTLHEMTHALQFSGVPWLREHLAALLRELVGSLELSLDRARVLKLPGPDDLRALAEAVREGDLMKLVAGPEQRVTIDRIQATMAVLEGHAEHVMDATGRAVLPNLEQLRAALDRRRQSQTPLAQLVSRLLGMDLKIRQYVVGKRFCDAIVAARGPVALQQMLASPQALPSLAELDDPNSWLARTDVPVVTSSGG